MQCLSISAAQGVGFGAFSLARVAPFLNRRGSLLQLLRGGLGHQLGMYTDWTNSALEEECARRGLRTRGTFDTLVERLVCNDEARAVDSRKRKAVDAEDQEALDLHLLHVSRWGSQGDVSSDLSLGANVNCASRMSPLMLACCREDWEVAEGVVRTLVSYGATVNLANEKLSLAIHYAAVSSSCAVVSILLDAKSDVDALNESGSSPLHCCCCYRDDEEGVKIARALLDRGAQLDRRTGDLARTPLMTALRHSSPEMVELLLARGADPKAADREADTGLILATNNGCHALALIPMIIRAGVSAIGGNMFS